jgi:membrane protein YqaA with SNARE-associated domain
MDPWGLVGYGGGSFGFGFVSGLVPAANTEAYLLTVAALAPPEAVPFAVVFVTAGQMAAKGLVYLAGRGAVAGRLLGSRAHRLSALRARIVGMPARASTLVFSSALLGLPPFYVVSLAAGSIRYSLPRFLLVGAGGRLIRFAAIVAVPALLRSAS